MASATTRLPVLALLVLGGLLAAAAQAAQFPTIDPAYTQQIYTGPLTGGPGMAWTPSQHLLTRNGSNSDILEYDPVATPNYYQGTSLHPVLATHTITGLAAGTGMTNGLDGYIYAVTGFGLQRFDPSNWGQAAQTVVSSTFGQAWGVATLSDGRIAYAAGGNNDQVYVFNPGTMTNTSFGAPNGGLIDGMVGGPSGYLAVTDHDNKKINILNSTGTLVQSVSTSQYPDGLAFSANLNDWTVYSNNNNGSITKYVFTANFASFVSSSNITGVSGAYGDLASVGPDCAFYVSQFNNSGMNGSALLGGTNWDNSVTTLEGSIVRIGAGVDRNGLPLDCMFYSPIDGGVPSTVPVPPAAYMGGLMLGGGWLIRKLRRGRGI